MQSSSVPYAKSEQKALNAYIKLMRAVESVMERTSVASWQHQT